VTSLSSEADIGLRTRSNVRAPGIRKTGYRLALRVRRLRSEDEDLMEMVNAGLLPCAIVDGCKAKILRDRL